MLVSVKVHSQRADSLRTILKSAQGVSKFDVLYELAYEYSNENDSLSLVYADQAYQVALTLGDTARIIKGGRIKAAQLRRMEDFEESILVAEEILPIAKRHKDIFELKILLTSLAISHTLRAEYDKALKYNFESLVVRENDGDKKGMSMSLNNIAVIYYKLQDFKRALDYYEKSLDLKNETKDKHDLDRLYINMGLCYNSLGEYDKSRKNINEGLRSCEGKCSDQIILEGEIALGISLLGDGHTDESLEHFTKSYDVAKRIKNHRYQAENLVSMAGAYLKKEDFSLAKKCLIDAEIISRQNGYRFLLERVYNFFSQLYEKRGDFQNQALYQSKYIKLKDSILSEKVISNLSQLRTDYQERENIKTIAEKDQLVSLQKEVITRQQRQFVFIVTITILIFALAGVLFYFSKRQQKTNRELSSMKAQLEVHNRELEDKVIERTRDLINSNKALREANDELDYFIYKSSHDIRGPLMTLKGMCNIANIDLKDQASLDYFKKFDLTVDRLAVILTRLQSVIYVNASELKPERINFHSLLDEIFLFEKKKGLPTRFELNYEVAENVSLISDARLVKLVCENLIDNAIKFCSTSERTDPFVKVRGYNESALVKIEVEDNGIGIDAGAVENIFKMFTRGSERSEIGGVGLYLAKIASHKIGGTLHLKQTDAKGTIFQVDLPLDLSSELNAKVESEQQLVNAIEKLSKERRNILPVI
ncbi:MAG TPA: hypothetical protein DGG95_16730 [Cytophagales bacterium]|nr:hypothetical protein [Cytophagales bacterium]